jgi:hypothetical protein
MEILINSLISKIKAKIKAKKIRKGQMPFSYPVLMYL